MHAACLMPASLFAFSDLETKPCGRPGRWSVVTHGMEGISILCRWDQATGHGSKKHNLFALGESGADDDKNAAWLRQI